MVVNGATFNYANKNDPKSVHGRLDVNQILIGESPKERSNKQKRIEMSQLKNDYY